MVFSWLRNRRRRRLAAATFPAAWRAMLRENVAVAGRLPDELERRLLKKTAIFAAEKHWEGCGGQEITDEVRLTIAAQACLLLLGYDDLWCFDRVATVLVYPDAYAHAADVKRGDLVVRGDNAMLGESWHRGPVVLAWRHAQLGGRNDHDGHNVVIHEFAHQLDSLAGPANGSPPLPSAAMERRWREVMDREYRRLVDAAARGRPTLLDHYGAADRAELFAVASECFFERAHDMRAEHSELYELLQAFYRLDPAAWTEPHARRDSLRRRASPTTSHDRDEPGRAPRAAARELVELIELEPESGDAHFTRGLVYLRHGDYRSALDEYDRAIEADPRDGEALRHRALALLGLDRYDEAIADSTRAIEIDRKDVEGHRARASALMAKGRWADALADCRIVLRARPDDVEARYLQGLAHLGLGDAERSVRDLSRAIDAAPGWAEAYAERSRAWRLLGKASEAAADRSKAIELDPSLAAMLR